MRVTLACGPTNRLTGFSEKSAGALRDEARAKELFNHYLQHNNFGAKPPSMDLIFELWQPKEMHLTGPCWRDFSKHVQAHRGWTARKTEATQLEKENVRHRRCTGRVTLRVSSIR